MKHLFAVLRPKNPFHILRERIVPWAAQLIPAKAEWMVAASMLFALPFLWKSHPLAMARDMLVASFLVLLATFAVLLTSAFQPAFQFGFLNIAVLFTDIASDQLLLNALLIWIGRQDWRVKLWLNGWRWRKPWKPGLQLTEQEN